MAHDFFLYASSGEREKEKKKKKKMLTIFSRVEHNLTITTTLLLTHTVTAFLYIAQGVAAHSPGP
jgi:hypothetical protein